MTDYNEDLATDYFEMRGYLVRKNLPYFTDIKNAPDSDVDLLIYHPHTFLDYNHCKISKYDKVNI